MNADLQHVVGSIDESRLGEMSLVFAVRIPSDCHTEVNIRLMQRIEEATYDGQAYCR